MDSDSKLDNASLAQMLCNRKPNIRRLDVSSVANLNSIRVQRALMLDRFVTRCPSIVSIGFMNSIYVSFKSSGAQTKLLVDITETLCSKREWYGETLSITFFFLLHQFFFFSVPFQSAFFSSFGLFLVEFFFFLEEKA